MQQLQASAAALLLQHAQDVHDLRLQLTAAQESQQESSRQTAAVGQELVTCQQTLADERSRLQQLEQQAMQLTQELSGKSRDLSR